MRKYVSIKIPDKDCKGIYLYCDSDEVITTSFTFIATAEVIALLKLTPVLVDVLPDTYNIDPDAVEQAITPKTKAIMPVSLYGQCADFDKINAITPATQGVAIDVPLLTVYPLVLNASHDLTSTPGADTSGLIKPISGLNG